MTEVTELYNDRDELCVKIDNVLLQFFTTLTDLNKEQAILEQNMKSGFLNMSRARYNMGIKSVGLQQCDENKMNASLKVKVDGDSKFGLEHVTDLETEFHDLEINSEKTTVRKRNKMADIDDLEQKNSEQKKIEEIGMKTINKEEIASTTKSGKIFDPIKWFGVLVPAALRQSQKDFRNSVEMAVVVANLKTKLSKLQKEYATLLKTKTDKYSDS